MHALFHTSKTAKMIKVILLKAPCQNVNVLLRCAKQSTIAVNTVINWSFFYYSCCLSIFSSNFINSESGVTICNQFAIRRLDMWHHQACDHSTHHRPLGLPTYVTHQVFISSHFWDNWHQTFRGHNLGLSGSRDVIGHVTIWFPGSHFL